MASGGVPEVTPRSVPCSARTRSAAAASDSTCSTDLQPGMTEVTAGSRSTQASATRPCRRRSPSRAQSARRLVVAQRDAKEADLAGLALRRQRLPQFVVLEDRVTAGVDW